MTTPRRTIRVPFVSIRGAFPDPLPADPVVVLKDWLLDAKAAIEGDFNAMVLATASPTGEPSARVVLCKGIEAEPPAVLFFTNYASRKGKDLERNPRAAGVFYWPPLLRQARFEGVVVRTTRKESSDYFRSRPLLSRIGAISSRQSEPLSSRAVLVAKVMSTAASGAMRRPESWGGYRVLLDRIELWSAGRGRLHDRVEWKLSPGSSPARWTATRLFP